MLDEKDAKLFAEVSIGEQHERTWNSYVKPFFVSKQEELFQAFLSTSSSDAEMLQNIRMQSNVLQAVESHFMEFINTGRLAQIQLEKK